MRQKVEMPKFKRFLINLFYDLKSNLKTLIHLPQYLPKILKIMTDSKERKTKYFLSTVVIVKNEARYLQEWLDFHLIIGVEHFYIYDNDSTDNILEILDPYISRGVVTYQIWGGSNQQLIVYNDAITKFRNDTEWLAILDADEFLVPLTKQSIKTFLSSVRPGVAQVLFGWMVFGSSGEKYYKNGLVLDRFRFHAKDDWIADSKPIIKPKRYLGIVIPHWVEVFGKTIDENGNSLKRYPQTNLITAEPMPKEKFRINHYYSKILEEFENKKHRGFADLERAERTRQDFEDHDQNDVTDNSIDALVEILKKKNIVK